MINLSSLPEMLDEMQNHMNINCSNAVYVLESTEQIICDPLLAMKQIPFFLKTTYCFDLGEKFNDSLNCGGIFYER